MRLMTVTPVLGLVLIALTFTNSQSPQRAPQIGRTANVAGITIEKQVSTQQQINRYFHGDVVPKLNSCWRRLQGKGKISLKYTFTRTGTRWSFNKLETEESTLPAVQTNLALRCMSDAVRSTSFSAEGAKPEQNAYIITWTWPVPFPSTAAQLTAKMFAAKANNDGETSGGCDGEGTPAKCFACSGEGENVSCKKVCVGYQECWLNYRRDGLITCTAGPQCASGGPFGVSGGGKIIY